jgi:hypothetical protein
MDAMSGGQAGSLRSKVEDAQNAITRAIAKANLTGDPMAPALEAMAESLGAQLALHEANIGYFREVSRRLDNSVSGAVGRGEEALEAKRLTIIEALAPLLAQQTTQSVRAWNRIITLKTMLSYGTFAVAVAFGVGMAGYGVGWQAGHASALETSGALSGAIYHAGSNAENALVNMVRGNNLAEAWAKCQKSAVSDKNGRRVCMMPMWADPDGQPVKG